MVLDLTDQLRETTTGMKNQLKLGNADILIKEDLKQNEMDTINIGQE
jgi:hypothetical protein